MWRDDQVRCRPQRIVGRQRFRRGDVDPRSAETALDERRGERRLVDQLTATRRSRSSAVGPIAARTSPVMIPPVSTVQRQRHHHRVVLACDADEVGQRPHRVRLVAARPAVARSSAPFRMPSRAAPPPDRSDPNRRRRRTVRRVRPTGATPIRLDPVPGSSTGRSRLSASRYIMTVRAIGAALRRTSWSGGPHDR